MAVATSLLFAAGIGLQGFSMFMQGRAAKAQAEGEEAMAEYNRKVSEQNAKAAQLKSTFDQQRQAKFGQRVMGTLRAKLGASGAVLGEGAPADLVTEQAEELALENALIGYEGQVTAGQYRSRATLYGMQADLAGQRAGAAMPAASIGAGATLLQGFGMARYMGMTGGGGGGSNINYFARRGG